MEITRKNIEEIILGMAELVAENRELKEENEALTRDNEWYKQAFHKWDKRDKDSTKLVLDLFNQSILNTDNKYDK